MRLFVTPLSAVADVPCGRVLTRDDIDALFCNWAQLTALHTRLLRSLEDEYAFRGAVHSREQAKSPPRVIGHGRGGEKWLVQTGPPRTQPSRAPTSLEPQAPPAQASVEITPGTRARPTGEAHDVQSCPLRLSFMK